MPVEAPALAAGLSLCALIAGWSGSDLPAHVFRADLVARYGLALWNDQWYGGHYLPAYGLSPLLGAAFGVRLVGLVACVAATACFSLLARRRFGSAGRLAAILFAVAAVPDVIVGRMAFGVGLAAALGSLAALQSGHRRLAVAAALATPLASPLAAAFLGLAAATGAAVTRSRQTAVIACCALVPAALLAALFPEGGSEPFARLALLLAGIAAAALAAWIPSRERTLRVGAVVYALVCLVSFAVPSPLGGNVVRLAMTVGAPLILFALWRRGRAVAVAAAVLVLAWQWAPAFNAIGSSASDPARSAAYFAPLLRFIGEQRTPARIEIPFTRTHWEAAYVAPNVPLARGWERQLDVRYDPLFYRPQLTAARYHAWLRRMAVGYVALPDLPLDSSAKAEAAVIAGSPKYLRLVHSDAHWRVWRVVDARPLVQGPARVARMTPQSVTLVAPAPALVVLRVHYTRLWSLTEGAGCVLPAAGGWTAVRIAHAGELRLEVASSPLRLLGGGGARCASP